MKESQWFGLRADLDGYTRQVVRLIGLNGGALDGRYAVVPFPLWTRPVEGEVGGGGVAGSSEAAQ